MNDETKKYLELLTMELEITKERENILVQELREDYLNPLIERKDIEGIQKFIEICTDKDTKTFAMLALRNIELEE